MRTKEEIIKMKDRIEKQLGTNDWLQKYSPDKDRLIGALEIINWIMEK